MKTIYLPNQADRIYERIKKHFANRAEQTVVGANTKLKGCNNAPGLALYK